MRKSLVAAMAAVTFLSAAASPAFADGRRHGWRGHGYPHHGDGDAAAAAVVLGVVGLAIGAAVMSSARKEAAYRQARLDAAYTVPPPPPPSDQAAAFGRPDAEGWYGPYAEAPEPGCFMERWVYDRELGRTQRERRTVDC